MRKHIVTGAINALIGFVAAALFVWIVNAIYRFLGYSPVFDWGHVATYAIGALLWHYGIELFKFLRAREIVKVNK